MKKQAELNELKEKYNNGEISKAKYFAQKLGVILLYNPKPQTNTKYLALGTTTA